jgi:uncharacterized membrane protein
VLAWLGVMATGFGFAPFLQTTPMERSRLLIRVGVLLCVGFFVLRLANVYGDPRPWNLQSVASVENVVSAEANFQSPVQTTDWTRTGISFLRTTKYPPSLAYLLMTLGPACLVFGWLERLGKDSDFVSHLQVFGRVPLFFYVLHFYLIHIASILTYWIVRGVPLSPFQAIYSQSENTPLPPEFGFQDLWQVYLAWFLVVVMMYPMCQWVGRIKRNGKSIVWSYL